MKILVAGGAGYVGTTVVPRLEERGYDVVVVDQCWFGNRLSHDTFLIERDIFDLVESDLDGFDQVIFLAGLSNDPMAEYSPSTNFVMNAACPAYLAYIAKRAGVARFIYASSCSVYGYSVDELFDENAPTISHYAYGISKLQGEKAVLGLQSEEFSVIVLRKGTVCGYSPRMRLDLVINTMFKTAVLDGIIRVNNPSVWRPVLALQDAAAAYVRAVECSPAISGVFNVASGNFTLGEIADYVYDGIRETLGISVKLEINRDSDLRNYKVSIEKARNVLSYKPRFSVGDIVRDLVQNRHLFSDLSNPRYSNIACFQERGPLTFGSARPLVSAAVVV